MLLLVVPGCGPHKTAPTVPTLSEPVPVAAPAPAVPESGPGSLTCCEASPSSGPTVDVATMVAAADRAGFFCLGLDDAATTRALHACMHKLDTATVKACITPDEPDEPMCEVQTYAVDVAGRSLVGLASDLLLDDYGWSVVELRDGEPHPLYPHGAPYVSPYCFDDEELEGEPDLAATLAEIPAYVEKAPPPVREWICAGPP